MKTLTAIILLFAVLCAPMCSSVSTKSNAEIVKTRVNCDGVPDTERLICAAGILRRAQIIFNDTGVLVEQRKLESDAWCSRIQQTWHYGASLPVEERMIRIQTFSVCSGSVIEKIQDQIVFGGLAFGAGFVTAVAVMAGGGK